MTDHRLAELIGYEGDIAEAREIIMNILEEADVEDEWPLELLAENGLIDVDEDNLLTVSDPNGNILGQELLENE